MAVLIRLGGGADLSDVTALAANVDRGKKFIDQNGDIITGTSDKIYTAQQYSDYGTQRYNAGKSAGASSLSSILSKVGYHHRVNMSVSAGRHNCTASWVGSWPWGGGHVTYAHDLYLRSPFSGLYCEYAERYYGNSSATIVALNNNTGEILTSGSSNGWSFLTPLKGRILSGGQVLSNSISLCTFVGQPSSKSEYGLTTHNDSSNGTNYTPTQKSGGLGYSSSYTYSGGGIYLGGSASYNKSTKKWEPSGVFAQAYFDNGSTFVVEITESVSYSIYSSQMPF